MIEQLDPIPYRDLNSLAGWTLISREGGRRGVWMRHEADGSIRIVGGREGNDLHMRITGPSSEAIVDLMCMFEWVSKYADGLFGDTTYRCACGARHICDKSYVAEQRSKGLVFATDHLIAKKWPGSSIVWTSVTCDIQIIKIYDELFPQGAYQVLFGDLIHPVLDSRKRSIEIAEELESNLEKSEQS